MMPRVRDDLPPLGAAVEADKANHGAAFAAGRAAGLREAAELVAEIKADPYYPLPKSDRDTLLRVIGWEDACDQIANAVRELADEGER